MAHTKNTHELSTGDIVEYYGCKFKLVERFNRQHKNDLEYDTQGVTWFRTECVEYKEGSMPKHWADTWIVQGNKNASWMVV